jgi:Reverse transcriptase (RNA-dependent DNA polymerase)
MFMRVPKGFEKFYPPDVVLLLERTLYGTKQAAMAFWKELLHVMKDIKMKQSKADPCLYYKWTDDGPMFWISWVDDILGIGSTANVMKYKDLIKNRMECEDGWSLNKYIECKVDQDVDGWKVKLTQPVLIHKFPR